MCDVWDMWYVIWYMSVITHYKLHVRDVENSLRKRDVQLNVTKSGTHKTRIRNLETQHGVGAAAAAAAEDATTRMLNSRFRRLLIAQIALRKT